MDELIARQQEGYQGWTGGIGMSQEKDKTVENMKQGQTVAENDDNVEEKAADMIDNDSQEMEKQAGSEELSANSSALNREAAQTEA